MQELKVSVNAAYQVLDPKLLGSLAEENPLQQSSKLIPLALSGGLAYGACMGLYSLLVEAPRSDLVDLEGWYQFVSSTVKVPALFVMTMATVLPSLFVFCSILGLHLSPVRFLLAVLRSLCAGLIVLGSLGTITAFFTLSTDSYEFMKLISVAFFALAGSVMLLRLKREVLPAAGLPAMELPSSDGDGTQALTMNRLSRNLIAAYLGLLAVVGSQMAWILRPFVGNPNLPFEVFRERRSNVFEDVIRTVGRLLGIV